MSMKGKRLPCQAVPRPSADSTAATFRAPAAQCSLVWGSLPSYSQTSLQTVPGLPKRTKALANKKQLQHLGLVLHPWSTPLLWGRHSSSPLRVHFNFEVQLSPQSLGMAALALSFSSMWRKGKEGWQQDVASQVRSICMLFASLPASLPSPLEDAGTDHKPTEIPGDDTICSDADELDSACQWQAAQTTPCLLGCCRGNDGGRNLVLSLCLFLSTFQPNISLPLLICEGSPCNNSHSKFTTSDASFHAVVLLWIRL